MEQTDRDRLLDLLKSFGIRPVTVDDPSPHSPDPEADGLDVLLVAHHGGVDGYGGFFAAFQFNEDGSFKSVGAYE